MATYVRTVSVYVDDVDSPEKATQGIGEANDILKDIGIFIRLPDDDSEYKWDSVGDDDYMKGMTPDEYAEWTQSMRAQHSKPADLLMGMTQAQYDKWANEFCPESHVPKGECNACMMQFEAQREALERQTNPR